MDGYGIDRDKYKYIYIRRKGKTEEKYVWWFGYLQTRFDFNIFLYAKSILSKLI